MPAAPAPIYIVGHKNPDTDAICSAIAYADFKHRTGMAHAVAARCGNTNPRIDAVLERFRQPAPYFLGDVTPRVEDIMVRDVVTALSTHTCAEVLERIESRNLRVLPLVDGAQRLHGQITLAALGQYFTPRIHEPRKMRHVFTSIADIVRSLRAEVLVGHETDRLEDLYVRIGAMDIRSFGRFAADEGIQAKNSVIVVGDRWDIQQKSIQIGVRLLVVTGSHNIDPDVVDMAREKHVSLIVSNYDSATTSWVIRSAGRVDRLADRKTVTFPAEEKLAVVRRKVAANYAAAYLVVDAEGRLEGLFTKTDLLKPVATTLILVDHNELNQAVTGAAEVNIAEIIDHHRLGNPPTQQPILFINDPVGSTCTIVAGMFRREGLLPSKEMAGVMMAGIVTDTLNLQSPTATARDADLLGWLAGIAGEDPKKLTEHLLSSGSIILSSTPEAVIRSDLKLYDEGGHRFSVSQVEEIGFANFWDHAEEIGAALETIRAGEGLLFASLLVTDINTQNSLLVMASPKELREQITFAETNRDGVYDLPGIVSRKKQLMPFLTSLLRTAGFTVAA